MNIKEETRQLWRLSFEDSEEFMDLYFSLRYSDRINKFIESEGKIVAALQTIHYTMTYGVGTEVPVRYISGACTHPNYRNKGFMKRLLRDVHHAMYEEGVWLSTLIPAKEWLKGFYRRSGYELCFHYLPYWYAKENKTSGVTCPREISLNDEVYDFFDRQMHKRKCSIQHSRDDLSIVIKDLMLAGGKFYGIFDDERLSGLAFCICDKDVLIVKEILLATSLDLNDVLVGLMQVTGTSKASCLLPTISEAYPLGMARVINAEVALRRYAGIHPNERLSIDVVGDDVIKENNGCRIINDGECFRINNRSSDTKVMTIAQLTRFLFSDLHPYMSLMMN